MQPTLTGITAVAADCVGGSHCDVLFSIGNITVRLMITFCGVLMSILWVAHEQVRNNAHCTL